MLDNLKKIRGRQLGEGDWLQVRERSLYSPKVAAMVMVFAGMVNGCVEVEYDPNTDPFRRHTAAGPQLPPVEAGGEDARVDAAGADAGVDTGVDAAINMDAAGAEAADADAGREAAVTMESGVVDVGASEDATEDVMEPDVADGGHVFLDVTVADAVNDVLVFVDAQKDAPEDALNTCVFYPAGANGTPTVFNFGLVPEATGPVTAFLAAGIFPAIGATPSNSWASDGAEFSLGVEPNTKYPGVAVFSGRYSIKYDVGASESDVYRVNLQEFSGQILSRECPSGDTVCLDLQTDVANADPALMDYIFNLENYPVVANMAKCTFNLPGAEDCTHNTVPFVFEGPEASGSFTTEFPLENRMYVGVMPCP